MTRPSAINALIITAAMAFMAGCKTTGPNGGTIVRIETTPPGATVTIPGDGACETPCTVEVNSPKAATIAKTGFKKQDVWFTPDNSRVQIDLEHAAPTTDVDAEDLPAL